MKRTVLFSLLPAIVGLCAAAAPAAPDPEIFESKGKDRNYAGVFPEKVKTIAVVTVGSYPSPATVKRAAALLRKAGYKVKIYPNALRPRGKKDVGNYATMPAKYRVRDFEAAWKDMENDMIICTSRTEPPGLSSATSPAGIKWRSSSFRDLRTRRTSRTGRTMARKPKACPERKEGPLGDILFFRYYCGAVCLPGFVRQVRPVGQVRKLEMLRPG